MCKSESVNAVQIVLEDSRRLVPVNRIMEDNNFCVADAISFALNVFRRIEFNFVGTDDLNARNFLLNELSNDSGGV